MNEMTEDLEEDFDLKRWLTFVWSGVRKLAINGFE
jgi:hypothetical protein